MGQDDRHLDFKTSFLLLGEGLERELAWVSVVRCNNNFGRVYLATITPFHRTIVPGFLTAAARGGWPMGAKDPAEQATRSRPLGAGAHSA